MANFWTDEQFTHVIKAYQSFPYFLHHIFAKNFDNWHGGPYIDYIGREMQSYPKTARVSARDHLKSTSVYAYWMWRLLRGSFRNEEWQYFSYQETMAGYHIGKLKQYIANNPYFEQCIDYKKGAESVCKYSWFGDGEHFFTLEPHGLLAFKRGLHGYGAFVDDPFQDPDNKMNLTKIKKVNDIFITQIMDIPSHELHVVGTPQTNEDFFFNKKVMNRFHVLQLPAIKDKNKPPEQWTDADVLWPEHMNAEELRHRYNERGPKVFSQEYLCTPVYSEDSFFKREELYVILDATLKSLNPKEYESTPNVEVIGGWDLGKKAHPAHVTIFEKRGQHWKQIFQIFFDGVDYTKQLDYVMMLCEGFKVDALYYDNTRGELESLAEQNLLPSCAVPVTLTSKTKFSIATEFEKAVKNKEISLINDSRQIDQILQVTNDLQAVETPQGHGDSFWSIAMCFTHYTAASKFSYAIV